MVRAEETDPKQRLRRASCATRLAATRVVRLPRTGARIAARIQAAILRGRRQRNASTDVDARSRTRNLAGHRATWFRVFIDDPHTAFAATLTARFTLANLRKRLHATWLLPWRPAVLRRRSGTRNPAGACWCARLDSWRADDRTFEQQGKASR